MRLLRLNDVIERTGLGRATIYLWMQEGKFPQRVKIGSHTVAWKESDIDDWISSRQYVEQAV